MEGVLTLPLFIDATDDEVDWLIDNSREVFLKQGDFFFREGEPAHEFYVVLDGELQVSHRVDDREVILGTTPRGVMGGEYFLLSGSHAMSTAQAIMPSRLMVFDMPAFLGIFTNCRSVGLKILATAAERMQGRASWETQREKMAALGKLSAGLAHELNNPAAAARRSSRMLQEMQLSHQAHTMRLGNIGMSSENLELLIAFMEQVRARKGDLPTLSTLDRADREDEICDWLDNQGVDEYWELGSNFVDWHITIDEIQTALSWAPPSNADGLLTWICDSLTTIELLDEIEQCAVQISELVGAVKSYTYMDRGAYQEVDIHKDLDNTLLILQNRLKDINIERHYDPELPNLAARGSALNQVWTNLIDNAIDAMEGQGTLKLITRGENNYAMVEVADDGPGIPQEEQSRLFEPFYTTKDVGSGTGLGLDITYRIIQDHKGSMDIRSEPGNTRFIVRLPVRELSDVETDNTVTDDTMPNGTGEPGERTDR